MGGGGHVVNASNGPHCLHAGGRVNADGGVVMVAASSTQVMFVIVITDGSWQLCHRHMLLVLSM